MRGMSRGSTAPVLTDLRLGGSRVVVRPTRADDAERAFALLHDRPEVLRWVLWSGPESVAELARLYGVWRRIEGGGGDYSFALVDRASEELVGSLALRFGGHPGTGDVGYWVGAPYQGRGLASEALRLVRDLAFEHLAAVLLVAQTDPENHASCRVLEKAGFRSDLETTVTGTDGPRRERHMSLARRAWLRLERTEPELERVELRFAAHDDSLSG